jgi:hypothetical protein
MYLCMCMCLCLLLSLSLSLCVCVFRERQKEQIALAISDALRAAISREVELGSSRLRGSVEAASEEVRREMTNTLQEVR